MKIAAPHSKQSRHSTGKTNSRTHQPASRTASFSSAEVLLFKDMRREAVLQRQLRTLVNNSRKQRSLAIHDMPNNCVQARQVTQLQAMVNNHVAYANELGERSPLDRIELSGRHQSIPGVVQRSLLKGIYKKKTVDTSGLKVTGTKPPDETLITCWKGIDEEGTHSAMWFSYTGEDEETVLGKIEWTGDGFRVIYGAKIDKYYKEPTDESTVSTIGKMLSAAKDHIDLVKGTQLLSHCHEFVNSLYKRL